MPHYQAKMCSKAQLTVPAAVREHLALKPGDIVDFYFDEAKRSVQLIVRNKSIFDLLKDVKLPSLGRPLTQEDIDDAVAEAMDEQERRIRTQRQRR